jgi:adenylate kinase family enzyme
MKPKRIAIIGNGGGGKTTLSRRLNQLHGLPLTHVDSIQFTAGMLARDREVVASILDELALRPEWIIDGYGPFASIEKRFEAADHILFVDFPLWRHYWWCTKRQAKAYWSPRTELPEGCDEASLSHTLKLYKIVWRVHTQIRPKLLEVFARESIQPKVFIIRTLADWRRVFDGATSAE